MLPSKAAFAVVKSSFYLAQPNHLQCSRGRQQSCDSNYRQHQEAIEKADQDLFIACMFLNPLFKAWLFNPSKLSVAM
jgi:hypothetical protein